MHFSYLAKRIPMTIKLDLGCGNRKLLILSLIIFFCVFTFEVARFTYSGDAAGDTPYYLDNGCGAVGQGHDLTLVFSKPLSKIWTPLVPLFFNFIFAFGAYFMIKHYIKYPELALVIAPLMPLTGVYAEIFAIALFFFAMGFYFRKQMPLALFFFCMVFLAHYWTGIFAFGLFIVFFLVHRPLNMDKNYLFLGSLCVVVMFFMFVMPQGMGFRMNLLFSIYGGTSNNWYLRHFFLLLNGNGLFILTSVSGLYILYRYCDLEFFKLTTIMYLIPLIVAFTIPNSGYWNWRLLYFMPTLPLTTVAFSWILNRIRG